MSLDRLLDIFAHRFYFLVLSLSVLNICHVRQTTLNHSQSDESEKSNWQDRIASIAPLSGKNQLINNCNHG